MENSYESGSVRGERARFVARLGLGLITVNKSSIPHFASLSSRLPFVCAYIGNHLRLHPNDHDTTNCILIKGWQMKVPSTAFVRKGLGDLSVEGWGKVFV